MNKPFTDVKVTWLPNGVLKVVCQETKQESLIQFNEAGDRATKIEKEKS